MMLRLTEEGATWPTIALLDNLTLELQFSGLLNDDGETGLVVRSRLDVLDLPYREH